MFTRHTISSKVLADTKECRQMLLVMASRSFLAASAALDQIKMMRYDRISSDQLLCLPLAATTTALATVVWAAAFYHLILATTASVDLDPKGLDLFEMLWNVLVM